MHRLLAVLENMTFSLPDTKIMSKWQFQGLVLVAKLLTTELDLVDDAKLAKIVSSGACRFRSSFNSPCYPTRISPCPRYLLDILRRRQSLSSSSPSSVHDLLQKCQDQHEQSMEHRRFSASDQAWASQCSTGRKWNQSDGLVAQTSLWLVAPIFSWAVDGNARHVPASGEHSRLLPIHDNEWCTRLT